MNYKIVRSSTHALLEKKITSEIRLGWRPIGGVAIGKGPEGSEYFYQAMLLKA